MPRRSLAHLLRFAANDKLIALLIAAVHLAITWPWLYRYGAGEPDSIAMIAGVYQAALKQTWFSETLYMLVGQPLYYGIFFAVPGLEKLSYDELALLMNAVSWIASGGSSACVYLLARRFSSHSGAALSALILISSPTVFEWSTYAHPVSVSIFLFLISANCAAAAFANNANTGAGYRWNRKYLLLTTGAIITGVAAMGIRADVAVLFYLFPLLPLLDSVANEQLRPFPWKRIATGTVLAILVTGIGLAGLSPFSAGGGSTGEKSAANALLNKFQAFFRPLSPLDGVLELFFGLGVVFSVILAILFVLAGLRRQWRLVIVATLLILPPLLYATVNPQPARRFMHAVYVSALAVALLWNVLPQGRWQRISPFLAALAFATNFILLPEVAKILNYMGYGVSKHDLAFRSTASVWRHHKINQGYLYTIERKMKSLRANAPEGSLLVGDFAHLYFLVVSASRSGLPVRVEVQRQSPGMIVTEVKVQDKVYYVAEYHPALTTESLPGGFPAAYRFNDVWTDTLADGTPIVNLSAPSSESFKMWFRPAR